MVTPNETDLHAAFVSTTVPGRNIVRTSFDTKHTRGLEVHTICLSGKSASPSQMPTWRC